MGVPVITLRGDRHSSRVGVSLMTNAGFEGLIAESVESYVGLASHLAGDVDFLVRFRENARNVLGGSALMDGKAYVRQVEQVFKQII